MGHLVAHNFSVIGFPSGHEAWEYQPVEGKILVVEDDSAIASMVELVLRTNGFETMLSARGDTAVAMVKEYNPDLILLDIMLPGKDGFSVASEIRSFSKVPIVMLTAKTDTEDIVRGLEASGADDYITKPCPPRVLLARIRSRLRVHDSQPLHIVDLTLDVKGHRVTRAGTEIVLTKTEFELLKHFALNPGQVFEREQLLQEVWRFKEAGDTRLVNVHIQRLRSKVEKDPENPEIIVSVRGVGYKSGHVSDL